MADTFTLSLAAVDILSDALDLDCRQYPFEVPGVGEFTEDRMRIAQAVVDDLGKRGLVRADRLDTAVAEALRLLARPQFAVAVLGTTEDGTLRARASAGQERAVLVEQNDQLLRFEFIRADSVPRRVVGLLPSLKSGPGQSVTISTPAAVAAKPDSDEHQGFARPLRAARSTSESQLFAAQEMLRKPRTGAGYFVVTGTKEDGNETMAPGLSWFDTEDGRYMAQADAERGGGTFAPADTARLTQQLEDLIQSVR